MLKLAYTVVLVLPNNELNRLIVQNNALGLGRCDLYAITKKIILPSAFLLSSMLSLPVLLKVAERVVGKHHFSCTASNSV